MKIAAGIIGLLLGLLSFSYIGLFGSVIGSSASWLGSFGPSGNDVENWGETVKVLSWLAPLLALCGGALCFKFPKLGGALLVGSVICHYQLLGFGSLGKMFVIPGVLASALALIDGFQSAFEPALESGGEFGHGSSGDTGYQYSTPSVEPGAQGYDRAKWNALVQYDPDISTAAEIIRPFGQMWVDELGSSYMALNDKSYLPRIVEQISERAKKYADDERREQEVRRQKQELVLAELRAEEEEAKRKWEGRRRKLREFYDKYAPTVNAFCWGTKRRKILTSSISAVFVAAVALTIIFWPDPTGKTFRDCVDVCPEMVVLPKGAFTMGPTSISDTENTYLRHPVTISYYLAVGKYDVTFAQWDACVASGGCNGYEPNDSGWGRGDHPVINVSWDDAHAYVAWLSAKTGMTYRLLSESEWEYAARGGTTTAYWWGDVVGSGNANCIGCGSRWDRTQTAPVGSFSANRYGLYDMLGNVEQWTEDCSNENYSPPIPWDGNPAISGNCDVHMLRGGSWVDPASLIRSAYRDRSGSSVRNYNVGFRVARIYTVNLFRSARASIAPTSNLASPLTSNARSGTNSAEATSPTSLDAANSSVQANAGQRPAITSPDSFTTQMDYQKEVRPALIKMGWRPVNMRAVKGCGYDDCPAVPEYLSCYGASFHHCDYTWEKGAQILEVTGDGEGFSQLFYSFQYCAQIVHSAKYMYAYECVRASQSTSAP